MNKPVLIITEMKDKSCGLKYMTESADSSKAIPEGCMRIAGVVAKVDVVNDNNRIYPRAEYQRHVDKINERIRTSNDVYGEYEHPQSTEVDWKKMTHQVEKLEILENGDVYGEFLLLDTEYGKIAQSIAKTGGKITPSSRAYGTLSEGNVVHLDEMITFDLVRTPGFNQADMRLSESLNPLYESKVENGNETISETKVYDLSECKKNNKSLNESELVESLENKMNEQLKIFKEELTNQKNAELNSMLDSIEKVNEAKVNDRLIELEKRIQTRIVEANNAMIPAIEHYVEDLNSKTVDGIDSYLTNDYAEIIEKWCKEDLVTSISEGTENYLKNEYSDVIEKWCKEDLRTNIFNTISEGTEKYLTNDYAEIIEKWCKEDLVTSISEGIENYLEKDFITEHNISKAKTKEIIESKINNSDLFKKLDEAITQSKNLNKKKIVEVNKTKEETYLKFIPESLKDVYESLSDNEKEEIKDKASLRDILNEEQSVTFWNSLDLSKTKIDETKVNNKKTEKSSKEMKNPLLEAYSKMMNRTFVN